MPLPNFLGIGVQKAATTTLFHTLVRHPEVYCPQRKECHFFDDDRAYEKGLHFYETEYFSHVGEARALGEITPSYFYIDTVPGRIEETLGSTVRFILTLRDPAHRAYSHYLHAREAGYERLPWSHAIEAEEKRIHQGYNEKIMYSYIDRGKYATQLKRYLNYFPIENFFVIIYEQDIMRDWQNTLNNLQNFLDINIQEMSLDVYENRARSPRFDFIHNLILTEGPAKEIARAFFPAPSLRRRIGQRILELNMTSKTPSLCPDEKLRLFKKQFESEVEELEAILERDLSVWKT